MSKTHKVGDRVKVRTPSGLIGYLSGKEGTVERLRSDGDVWIRFDGELPKHLQSKSGLVRMHSANLAAL